MEHFLIEINLSFSKEKEILIKILSFSGPFLQNQISETLRNKNNFNEFNYNFKEY